MNVSTRVRPPLSTPTCTPTSQLGASLNAHSHMHANGPQLGKPRLASLAVDPAKEGAIASQPTLESAPQRL